MARDFIVPESFIRLVKRTSLYSYGLRHLSHAGAKKAYAEELLGLDAPSAEEAARRIEQEVERRRRDFQFQRRQQYLHGN